MSRAGVLGRVRPHALRTRRGAILAERVGEPGRRLVPTNLGFNFGWSHGASNAVPAFGGKGRPLRAARRTRPRPRRRRLSAARPRSVTIKQKLAAELCAV